MECREQRGNWQCGGMYLGFGKGEGGAEVHGACGTDQKVEGTEGLLESDGWVVEVKKVEVGMQKVEVEVEEWGSECPLTALSSTPRPK